MSYATERGKRDTGLQRLSSVQGDLAGLAKAAQDGFVIQVELTYGWLYARRARDRKLDVAVFGDGRGFCWRQRMTRVGLRNRMLDATTADPQVRRGPREVWPLE